MSFRKTNVNWKQFYIWDSGAQNKQQTTIADHIDLTRAVENGFGIRSMFYLLHSTRYNNSSRNGLNVAGSRMPAPAPFLSIRIQNNRLNIFTTECRLADNWDILLLSFAHFSFRRTYKFECSFSYVSPALIVCQHPASFRGEWTGILFMAMR